LPREQQEPRHLHTGAPAAHPRGFRPDRRPFCLILVRGLDLRGCGREHVRQEAFRYIECYYNRRRIHSTLGYLAPVEYEEQLYEAGVSPVITNDSEVKAA
jgi:hypothetical protein